MNILVVDDQPAMRATLKGVLGKRGYQVSVAESGEAADAAASQRQFHLILMDIKMGGISGVEAFERIKEISPKSSVILMTAYAVEDELKRAIRDGAYTVVHKPFDMSRLLEIIADCLDERELVMVVEDRVEDLQLIRSILERKGYRVGQARSGEECLKQMTERKFQIVLMDLRLPGMSGMQAIEEIQKVRPGTPIVVVTALCQDDLKREAARRGSAFLCKPFQPDTLLHLLGQAVRPKEN